MDYTYSYSKLPEIDYEVQDYSVVWEVDLTSLDYTWIDPEIYYLHPEPVLVYPPDDYQLHFYTIERSNKMRILTKDPEDLIIIRFNYSEYVGTISSAVVTIYDKTGATVPAMISGSATVAANLVQQKVGGGVANASYTIKCKATTASGEELVIKGTLNIK